MQKNGRARGVGQNVSIGYCNIEAVNEFLYFDKPE